MGSLVPLGPVSSFGAVGVLQVLKQEHDTKHLAEVQPLMINSEVRAALTVPSWPTLHLCQEALEKLDKAARIAGSGCNGAQSN